MDHRPHRPRHCGAGRKPLRTVYEYVQRGLHGSARFQAISARHAINTLSERGTVAQKNRASAWMARWRHVPCWMPAAAGGLLLYVCCEGEEKNNVTLLKIFSRYSCYDGTVPDIGLVTFPGPFYGWYSVADRAW